MDKFILKFKDKVIEEHVMSNNRIVIGRQSDSDIVINNIAVSKHHAEIVLSEGTYTVSDMDSTNGTFVNKKKIKQLEIRDQDEILIGKHTIVFQSDKKESNDDTWMEFGESTMILDTKQHRKLVKKNSAASGKNEPKKAQLTIFESGKKRVYKISKDVIIIGKSDTCDIKIKGFLVPQIAITIRKEQDVYYIYGYGGWITISINGNPLRDKQKLLNHDRIKIRNVKLIFGYLKK